MAANITSQVTAYAEKGAVALLCGLLLVAVGALGNGQVFTGIVAIVTLLVFIQVRVSETSLRDALSVGIVLFGIVFVVVSTGSIAEYSTVVFRGSNSYTQFATEMATRPLTELGRPPDNDYYYIFLTVLYTTGPLGRVVPILANLVALCYLTVFTYRLTKFLFDETHAANALILLVAFPTVHLHTYATRPDMLTAALVIGIVYVATLLHHRLSRRLLAQLGVYFLLLTLLRLQLASLMLFVLLASTVLGRLWAGFSVERLLNTGLLAMVTGTVMYGFAYGINLWGVRSLSLGRAIQRVLTYQADTAAGLSSIVYSAPAPVRLLLGVVPLLIAPFPPWESIIASQSMAFYTVGGIVFFGLAPFALVGLSVALRRLSDDQLPLVLYTVAMTGVLALVYGGFAVKFRLLLVPPLIIFASIGLGYTTKYRYFILLFITGYPALIILYTLLNLL